jgi:hypothetical protein
VTFSSQTSLALLAVVMVAGLGRVSGAVIAGVMLTLNGFMVEFLNTTLNIAGGYQLVVAGLALTITAIANPNGIAANPPPPLVWVARRIGNLIPGGWAPQPRAQIAAAPAAALAGEPPVTVEQ